jgi:hypothetical protein
MELISLIGSVRLREEVARGKGAMRLQSRWAMIIEPGSSDTGLVR